MKASTVVLIYFGLLGICIYYSNIILISLVILGGIIALISLKVTENSKINYLKQWVSAFEKGKKVKVPPFVNVNKEGWKVLQELPNIDRVQAKKIVYIRKHKGNYSSLEDFFVKNLINNEEDKNVLKKFVCLD